jgi:DNA-binding transcriptional LysR family regulator
MKPGATMRSRAATRAGAVDDRAAFDDQVVHASLEFSDGQRPGLRSAFVVPLTLSPYAAPAWTAVHGSTVNATMPRASLIHHQTLPGAWDGWFQREGIAGEAGREGPRYEIMSMALNASVAGMGVALLPPYMGDDMVAAGRLQRLSTRSWRYTKGYYLVYPEDAAQLKSLQIFRAWLLAQADGLDQKL